jgi:hypothetical protein
MKTFWEKTKRFVVRYERHLSVAAMVGGFVADNIGLHRADLPFDTGLLYFYIASAGLLILIVHLIEEGVWQGRGVLAARPWLLLSLQVIFGSTMSAFLVFYSHEASFSATWPLLLVIFAVFAGTEIFKHYQDRLGYQYALYFFSVFSFSVYTVPIFVGAIGTNVFLLSGALATAAFALFALLLYATGRKRFQKAAPRVFAGAASVLVLMNVLYFTHLLPPLPLALKNIGVFHSITHTSAGYVTEGEPASLVGDLLGVSDVHIRAGEAVYVGSSIFTPLSIRTNIVHRWQRWDAVQNKWVTNTVITFPVVGGNDGGYRGYSEIPNIPAGKWRVSVETQNGAVIGRLSFTVTYVATEPPLVSGTL